ncbi:MAG: response regulator transcription factor [Acidimicrobiia bacterium]
MSVGEIAPSLGVRVLVADDDRRVLRVVAANLERAGYDVVIAADGIEATTLAAREQPDLAILDVMMPARDGFETAAAIRAFSDVPIIFLSARGEQVDKVHGLDLGADDYVTKPFGLEELLARVRAVLRRHAATDATGDTVEAAGVRVDRARRSVTVGGEDVKLTPTEYRLLVALITRADMVCESEDLLEAVWGPEYRGESEYLWTYVRYLRNKIEADPRNPRLILTEPGVGYRFAVV